MADEKPPFPSNEGARRRKPPVIDLEAREIPPETPAPEPPVEQQAATEPMAAQQTAAEESVAETPPPPPPDEPAAPESEPSSDRKPVFRWVPGELSWSHAIAGFGGVIAGLFLVLLLWLGGVFS